MHSVIKWLFIWIVSLNCSCTVVHVISESGTVETHWLPGISYVSINASDHPLYVQSETFGIGLTNKSMTLGYGFFEQVVVEGEYANTCLLLSVSGSAKEKDFSFQTKDPDYVCKGDSANVR